MNFNLSKKPDYSLQARMTDEMINLYGVQVKFLLVEKINIDKDVFGDYSHIKTDNKKVFTVFMMPESSEEFANINYSFSQFGYQASNTTNMFISKKSMEKIFPSLYNEKNFGKVLGNLIVLPNDGLMEITDCQFEVPGVSNLYTNNDSKNVFKLSLITYNNTQSNEIAPVNAVQDNFSSLNDYFEELINTKEDQDDNIELTGKIHSDKPLVQEPDSVFGRF